MFTVRGDDDPAYWDQGHWKDELGFYIKYPGEYEGTQKTKAMLGNESWSTYIQRHGFQVSKYGFLQRWPYKTEFLG